MSDSHPPQIRPSDTSVPKVVDQSYLVASRERLSATTESVAIATARLEKFLVTEQRVITVDVAREEVRVSYGPLAADHGRHRGGPGLDSRPGSASVVLFAEEIEIVRRWVPVETARLVVITSIGEETLTDTVRAEQIQATSD